MIKRGLIFAGMAGACIALGGPASAVRDKPAETLALFRREVQDAFVAAECRSDASGYNTLDETNQRAYGRLKLIMATVYYPADNYREAFCSNRKSPA
jgi:hypothetical protein